MKTPGFTAEASFDKLRSAYDPGGHGLDHYTGRIVPQQETIIRWPNPRGCLVDALEYCALHAFEGRRNIASCVQTRYMQCMVGINV